MKTYHIKWSGTVYETAEVQAKDEDEAMEIFNNGDGKTISWITKHGDIDEIKEVSNEPN